MKLTKDPTYKLLLDSILGEVGHADLFRQPFGDARDRIVDVLCRARVREANERAAVNRIEVDARRGRDMRLFQHSLGKFKTVRRERRYVGVEVERADVSAFTDRKSTRLNSS